MQGSVVEPSRISWWRHQMETFSALLAICAGNSPVPVNSPHKGLWRGALMFVCFITKSFLTYSFVLPTPTLSTICRHLSSYVCSITPETANVGSSYNHMRGPGVGCWFSDRSNCSHGSFEAAVLPINPNIYTDQWEPIVIYHSITLLVVIQLCSPRCWHLDSNYCRTRCRQSQLRFVMSPLLLHLRLLIVPVGYSTFHIDLASLAQS